MPTDRSQSPRRQNGLWIRNPRNNNIAGNQSYVFVPYGGCADRGGDELWNSNMSMRRGLFGTRCLLKDVEVSYICFGSSGIEWWNGPGIISVVEDGFARAGQRREVDDESLLQESERKWFTFRSFQVV